MADTIQPYEEFSGFLGVNNQDAPERIDPHHLQKAINVNNTIDGRLVSRRGSVLVSSTEKHSLWSNRDETVCLFMEGTTLKQLHVNETDTVIKEGFTAGAMHYADGADRIFLTNGNEIGCILNGVYYDMRDASNYGFIFPALEFNKVMPLAGNGIEWWYGRLYVLVGDKVFYSDAYRPTQFDLRENFLRFNGIVTMFRGVTDGIWAADGSIRFLAGRDPKAGLAMSIKAPYDYHKGSDQFVDGSIVGSEGMSGKILFFSTEGGICIGGSDGGFHNLTVRKYQYPSCKAASAAFMHADGINRYVVSHKN